MPPENTGRKQAGRFAKVNVNGRPEVVAIGLAGRIEANREHDSLPSMAVNLVKVAESISTEMAELALAGMGTIGGIALGAMIIGLNVKVMIAASRLKGAIALQTTKQPQKTTVGPLRNERHEVFAYLVANGVSAPQSYGRSYACAVDAATRVSAHRLLKNANIRSRIEDHQAEILHKAADTHCAVLDQIKAEILAQAKAGHLRAACRTTERLVKMAEKLESALSQSAQVRSNIQAVSLRPARYSK